MDWAFVRSEIKKRELNEMIDKVLGATVDLTPLRMNINKELEEAGVEVVTLAPEESPEEQTADVLARIQTACRKKLAELEAEKELS